MKKRIIISLFLCVVLAVTCFAFSSCQKKKTTPTEYFFDAIEATFEKSNNGAFADLINKAMNGGSLELAFNNTNDLEDLGFPIDSISFKEYLKGKDYASVDMSLGMNGNVANIKTFATLDKVAISSSSFGDKIYEINFDKEKYLNSVFADSDCRYSLAPLFGENGEIFERMESSAEFSKELTKILEKYGDILVDLIDEKATVTLSEEEDGKVVTIEINNDSLKAILKEVYSSVKKDSELRNFVVQFLKLVELSNGSADGESSASLFGGFTIEDYDEALADEEGFQDLLDAIDETPFSIKTTIHTDKNDMINLMELSVNVGADGEEVGIILGLDMKDENKTVISLKAVGDDAPQVLADGINIVYEITENTDTKLASELSVSLKSEGMEIELAIFNFEIEKASGEYKISLPITGLVLGSASSQISLSGKYLAENDSLEFSVESLYIFETTVELDISLKVLAKDTIPEYPKNVTDFFTLDEDDIDEIIEAWGEEGQKLGLDELFRGNAENDMLESYMY